MKIIFKIFFVILSLAVRLLESFWSLVLFVAVLIDGGDDEDDYSEPDTVNYNYRTGELDPVKRIDGEYGNK